MDINKQNQQAGDYSNQIMADTVNQYLGIQISDIVPLVHSLVKSEMEIYQQIAEVEARVRFEEFTKTLESTIEEKVSDKVEKFAEPAMQYAARQATLGYIKSGEPEQKNALIDLLIERMSAEDRSSKQLLIDEAIQILPKLSSKCIAALTLITYSNLKMVGLKSYFLSLVKNLSPVLASVVDIDNLDIEYLVQTGCLSSILGFQKNMDWLQSNIANYPLLFSHYENKEAVDRLKSIYGIICKDSKWRIPYEYFSDAFISLFRYLEFKEDGSIIPSILNLEQYSEAASKMDPFSYDDIMSLIDHRTPMTKDEVIEFYRQIDSNWEKIIPMLIGKFARYDLTLVGKYIGLRQLSKLTNISLSIDKFLSVT